MHIELLQIYEKIKINNPIEWKSALERHFTEGILTERHFTEGILMTFNL